MDLNSQTCRLSEFANPVNPIDEVGWLGGGFWGVILLLDML